MKRFVELVPNLTTYDRELLRVAPNEEVITIRAVLSRDVVDRIRYWETRRGFKPSLRRVDSRWYLNFWAEDTPENRPMFQKIFDPTTYDLKPIPALETLKILMSGLLPNRGRNEKDWVQVDAETKKLQQVSGAESFIHLYFRAHILAEQQLLHVIVGFLE